MSETQFPHMIDCYLLVARNGQPPAPGDDPVATMTVYSEAEVEQVKKEFQQKYPGGWIMERPLDIR